MGRLLLVLLMLLPLVEIALFVVIGRAVGLWPTLLGVVVAALAGLIVLRQQGRALFGEIRATMAEAALPGKAMADAMMVFIAGILLIVPGYFSDLVAILLLLPPVRTGIYGWLWSRFTVVSTTVAGFTAKRTAPGQRTIDLDAGDWRREE